LYKLIVSPGSSPLNTSLEVVDSLAIELVVKELALIPVAILKVHDSFARSLVLDPLANVDVAIGEVECALAMEHVVQELALVAFVLDFN